jgi:hypothetical protein
VLRQLLRRVRDPTFVPTPWAWGPPCGRGLVLLASLFTEQGQGLHLSTLSWSTTFRAEKFCRLASLRWWQWALSRGVPWSTIQHACASQPLLSAYSAYLSTAPIAERGALTWRWLPRTPKLRITLWGRPLSWCHRRGICSIRVHRLGWSLVGNSSVQSPRWETEFDEYLNPWPYRHVTMYNVVMKFIDLKFHKEAAFNVKRRDDQG